MRFKAEISNMDALLRLVSSVEKLSHRAILKLTEDVIYLICAGEANTNGGPQVWAQIKVPSVFAGFRIESNTDNQIFLEFVPTALSKALRSASAATSVVVRLAKRASTDHPILLFNIDTVSRSNHTLSIVQEVAVRVLKLAEVQEMAKEPMCPEPDVHIVLPSPSDTLRTVVDRMKNSHNVIHLSANLDGQLRLRVESDLVNIETTFRGLKNPSVDVDASQRPSQRGDGESDPTIFHSVAIESKHLLKLLAALANGSHTIACICAKFCTIFYVYISSSTADSDSAGILTFFVPGFTEGE